MQTKLTLRMEKSLIEKAKIFANTSGKSVSQLVADYFALLDDVQSYSDIKTTKTVSSLKGIMKGHLVDEEDYKRHLVERHI